jgi:hypothetical protein
MDRRQAIKKLAAGTALASGGSMVLSSRVVAYASSAGPSDPVITNNSNGTVTIAMGDGGAASCEPGSETAFAWRIDTFNLKGGNTWRFFIRNSTDTADIAEGEGGNSGFNTNYGTVVLRKSNKSGKLKPLDNGDTYVLTTNVLRCGGSPQVAYRISGTYPNPPTIEPS